MKELTLTSLLENKAFEAIRASKQKEIIALKKRRRLFVGPFAIFDFECFETLWWQIQEMVRIEKGGVDQQRDELAVYQPLLPQGSDWRATCMLEIPEETHRRTILKTLGHIEYTIALSVGDFSIRAEPLEPEDIRTTDAGKTSAVHFLKFMLPTPVKKQLLEGTPSVSLQFEHPHYTHTAVFPPSLLETLKQDLEPEKEG